MALAPYIMTKDNNFLFVIQPSHAREGPETEEFETYNLFICDESNLMNQILK